MQSKKLIAAFSVCALLLATVGFVQANPFTHNRSHNSSTYDLTPEKAAAVDAIQESAQSKIQPLRDQLYAKRLELDALSQNPNTKPATIKQLTEDISELRTDIREQRTIASDKIEEETGIRNVAGNHRGNRGDGHRNGGSRHNGSGYGHRR